MEERNELPKVDSKMEYTLDERGKEFLERVLLRDEGRWLSNVAEIKDPYHIMEIIDRGRYDSFDREMLNEIRSYWVDGYSMKI